MKFLESIDTSIENPQTDDDRWAIIRHFRNLELQATDWTQLIDAPLTNTEKEEWIEYRRLLRDIPQQPIKPNDVEFPERPLKYNHKTKT